MASGTHFPCFFCPWRSSRFIQSREGPLAGQGSGSPRHKARWSVYIKTSETRSSAAVTERSLATLKYGLEVTQDYWKWCRSEDWNGFIFAFHRNYGRLFSRFTTTLISLKCDTLNIWKLGCGFLFAFHGKYGRICSQFGDIQRQRMTWPWNLGMGSFKVIENDTVR